MRKGIHWVQGTFEDCLITFPADKNWAISIGTDAEEEPTLLIESEEHVYLYVCNERDRDYDYLVMFDMDAPFIPAHSGEEYKYGNEVFRLI